MNCLGFLRIVVTVVRFMSERIKNFINVDYDRMQIKDGIEKALHNKTFRDELKDCVNPYGDGHSSGKIVKILEEIKINEKLLDKRITY